MSALLDDLLARWVEEAAERGDRGAVAALREDIEPEETLEQLRREPDPEVGSPWRWSA